jgi:hypothetical protein
MPCCSKFSRISLLIPSIEAAPLRLNALVLKNVSSSVSELSTRIARHYVTQGLSGVYAIVGSTDVLGAPFALVTNLGSAFKSFFEEPSARSSVRLLSQPLATAVGTVRKVPPPSLLL